MARWEGVLSWVQVESTRSSMAAATAASCEFMRTCSWAPSYLISKAHGGTAWAFASTFSLVWLLLPPHQPFFLVSLAWPLRLCLRESIRSEQHAVRDCTLSSPTKEHQGRPFHSKRWVADTPALDCLDNQARRPTPTLLLPPRSSWKDQRGSCFDSELRSSSRLPPPLVPARPSHLLSISIVVASHSSSYPLIPLSISSSTTLEPSTALFSHHNTACQLLLPHLLRLTIST